MKERIYRVTEAGWEERAERDPNRRYTVRNHPETGEVCYLEFTDAQEAKRDAEEAAHRQSVENPRPRPPTLQEQLEELRARIAELEKGA